MIRLIVLVAVFTFSAPALAQQQPVDSITLQRMLSMTQIQRNQLFDALTASEAKAQGLVEELAKANARIKELEPKPDAKAE